MAKCHSEAQAAIWWAHDRAPLQRDLGAIVHLGCTQRVMEENYWGGLADGPMQLAAKHGGEVVGLKAQGEYAEWGPAYLDLRTARHDK